MIQDLINEIESEQEQENARQQESKTRQEEFKQMFYKDIWLQEKTDKNRTKCLMSLKNGN